MASHSDASAASSSQTRQSTQGKKTPKSVRDYVSGGQTTPVEHLSAGNGKPTALKDKVEKAKKAIEKWEQEWKNASGRT